jgi:DUF218 domain
MNKSLLILLGSQNYEDGRLTAEAISRCEAALKILQQRQEMKVLPTGAFGNHFNCSLRPHGTILADYLSSKGISSDRILPFTRTAGTVEDALAANKIATELRIEKLTILTSDFHMERSRYIFERICRGKTMEFVEAKTPDEIDIEKERRHERHSLSQLQKNWVDVPDIAFGFPKEVYKNASEEQKHYDNLSLAIASGILIVFSFAYASDLSRFPLGRPLSFIFAALIILGFLGIYDRACNAARTARRVLRQIEIAFDCPGFSTAHWRTYASQGFFSIRMLIYIMSIAMILCLLVSAIFLCSTK